jgi:V/A-type H+-transporting ATPase subunit B
MNVLQNLVRHTRLLEIVGDLIRVQAEGVAFGDLAMVENIDGERSLAKVVDLDRDVVSLQVFSGGKGTSTDAKVNFLGRSLDVIYSNISQQLNKPPHRELRVANSRIAPSLLTEPIMI